jgi:hypothetical protein
MGTYLGVGTGQTLNDSCPPLDRRRSAPACDLEVLLVAPDGAQAFAANVAAIGANAELSKGSTGLGIPSRPGR